MAEFKDLSSLDEAMEFIENHEMSFLYFTMPSCSVCHGLKPQIEAMLEKYPKIEGRHIDASLVPEAAGQFSVFTAPVLLLFIDGKEYLREARIVQTQKLDDQLNRIYTNMVN